MRYRILNTNTGEYESDQCCPAILTQDGKVAHWSECQGWEVDDNQEQFEVHVPFHSGWVKVEEQQVE